jgi:hypothetical protein
VNVNYTANGTTGQRIATVTITVTGLTPQTVTVTQAASSVGIGDHQLSDIRVYPNPTNGVFKVTGDNLKNYMMQVSVLDMSGKNIITKLCSGADDYTFDISQQPKGFYFVRLNSENTTLVKRIVLID